MGNSNLLQNLISYLSGVVLITMLICCATYHSLKKEVIEAMVEQPGDEDWWNDQSGQGMKFGEGGGGGDPIPPSLARTKNPFKRYS